MTRPGGHLRLVPGAADLPDPVGNHPLRAQEANDMPIPLRKEVNGAEECSMGLS